MFDVYCRHLFYKLFANVLLNFFQVVIEIDMRRSRTRLLSDKLLLRLLKLPER